jgi:5-methylthioadenosine/S-adenosylhomocysteine deaminase
MMFDLVLLSKILISPTEQSWIEKENHVIAIREGKIAAVEPAGKSWKSKFKAKKYLDLSHHLVIPGLVNAHTHLPMTLFRGLAEDMDFHEWLNDYILPIEREILDKNFVKVGTQLAVWESIKHGVTCVNDMYYFTDVIMDVLDKTGLRGHVGQTFMSFPTPDNKKQDRSDYNILQRNITKYKKNSRLTPVAAPHAPYTCNDELLKSVREFANENDIPLHIHVSETSEEVKDSIKQFGKSPVKRLYDLGVMDGKTSFAHAIHLSDEDIKLIQKKNCGVIHNPESNMKIKAGVCRIRDLLDAGVSLGLGTDGAASNNNLNIVEEMDVGIKLQKLQGAKVSAKDFLKMATLGSATALGLNDQIGSIEVGKCADLVAFDLNQPQMMPMHDPVSQMVFSANGSEATHVLCDGKVLMSDGKFSTLNVKQIQTDVSKYKNKIHSFLKKRTPTI